MVTVTNTGILESDTDYGTKLKASVSGSLGVHPKKIGPYLQVQINFFKLTNFLLLRATLFTCKFDFCEIYPANFALNDLSFFYHAGHWVLWSYESCIRPKVESLNLAAAEIFYPQIELCCYSLQGVL